jgi:hypothetical protein
MEARWEKNKRLKSCDRLDVEREHAACKAEGNKL